MRHSTAWKSSTQPRKQRKYRYTAPLHVKATFLGVHLTKELRQKHGTRAVRVRVGDKVRVMRGSFKGREGKVSRVDVKATKVYVEKIETLKKDGATKVPHALAPSSLMLVELDTSDKQRLKK